MALKREQRADRDARCDWLWHLHSWAGEDGSGFADGVIVRSAIVQIIEENLDTLELVNRVGDFVASLSNALRTS